MAETWLRTNRRVLALAMTLPALIVVAGAAMVGADYFGSISKSGWLSGLGCALCAIAAWGAYALTREMKRPRLAYANGQLLAYLRGATPIRVPIEIVEGFLLGQAPSNFPGGKYDHTDTAAVVIRLAQSAEEWSHLEVKPSLGKWCDGYVTIRGAWCEPLDVGLVQQLNQRLADANQLHASAKPRA